MADATRGGLPCPNCRVDLVMADRQGVEIDYCPKCRGVWLDRGELDKIVERTAAVEAPAAAPGYRQPERRDDDDRYRDDKYRRPYKRKSLLGEIFDF